MLRNKEMLSQSSIVDEKSYKIRVKIFDEEIKFDVRRDDQGKIVFDSVCRCLGLREVWFFGLVYDSMKELGMQKWLKMDKKLCNLKVVKEMNNVIRMIFTVKFYPDNFATQLAFENTQHLFYLEAHQQVADERIFCPVDVCILLASYTAQAKYGNYISRNIHEIFNEVNELLNEIPKETFSKYKMAKSVWKEKIVRLWSEHVGLTTEQAEMEYLKVVSKLEMYGTRYFDIENGRGTKLHLGVDALGMKFYKNDCRIEPELGCEWNEITDVRLNWFFKKFMIKINNTTSQFKFHLTGFSFKLVGCKHDAKLLYEYCKGYFYLHQNQLKPSSIELRVLRQQAIEIKEKQLREKNQLKKFVESRVETLKKRDELTGSVKEDEEKLLKIRQEAINKIKEAEEEKRKSVTMQHHLQKLRGMKKADNSGIESISEINSDLVEDLEFDGHKSGWSKNIGKQLDLSGMRTDDQFDEKRSEILSDSLKNKLLILRKELKEAADKTKVTVYDSIYENNDESKYSSFKKIRSQSPNLLPDQLDNL